MREGAKEASFQGYSQIGFQPEEARKQAPKTRRSNTSHKDRTQDKEEPKAAEEPESQRDHTAREANQVLNL